MNEVKLLNSRKYKKGGKSAVGEEELGTGSREEGGKERKRTTIYS